MPRQLLSSFAPPRWHSSITMKSKKSGGYSPKYGDGLPSFGGPLMKVWKMVKNRLAFFGTLPILRRSEEHTSELQSQSNLVCRLLLEKKTKICITLAA